MRGSEYPAIVEYAPFQGLPKARARKKDKHVGTLETEQHFLNFLDQLKEEESENQKETKTSVEYSYQLKDDKKITTTPLIEFLASKNQEKRDAKRRKQDDKRKQRDDEKTKKKIQVAKNVPESIREVREEAEDGIMVRTVPSRLGRNDRRKDSKSEGKGKPEEPSEKEKERCDGRDKNKEARILARKEKDEKRKAENAQQRAQQKAKEEERKKSSAEGEKSTIVPAKESQREPKESQKETSYKKEPQRDAPFKKEPLRDAPVKNETKRYSALRKARQEKSSDNKEVSEAGKSQPDLPKEEVKEESNIQVSAAPDVKKRDDEANKLAREKRAQENKDRRKREAERALRNIKNKDRPTLQIYQPKRRPDKDSKDIKSSDENSEASRIKSDCGEKNTEKPQRQRMDDELFKSLKKNSKGRPKQRRQLRRGSDDEIAADTSKASSRSNISFVSAEYKLVDRKAEETSKAFADDEKAGDTSKARTMKEQFDFLISTGRIVEINAFEEISKASVEKVEVAEDSTGTSKTGTSAKAKIPSKETASASAGDSEGVEATISWNSDEYLE